MLKASGTGPSCCAAAYVTLAFLIGALGPATPALAQSAPAHRHHAHRAHRRALAVTPSPQPEAAAPQAASATSPAPVPDEAVTAPLDHTAPSADVSPRVFQLHYPPQGEGYVTGSSPQALDDRNAAKATGVQATVPLPQ